MTRHAAKGVFTTPSFGQEPAFATLTVIGLIPARLGCAIVLALWSARKSNVELAVGTIQGSCKGLYGVTAVRPGTKVIGSVKPFPARQRGVRAAAAALGA